MPSLSSAVLSKLAVIGFAALAFVVILPSGAGASVSAGEAAPALVVKDLKGRTFDLQKLRGKTVIVNVWASWCAPCQGEIPVLDAFYKAHHGKGVEMIGLSVDRRREKADAREMARKMSYPVAFADEAEENGFGDVRSLPATYIIDAGGNVAAVFDEAPVTEKQLTKAIHAN